MEWHFSLLQVAWWGGNLDLGRANRSNARCGDANLPPSIELCRRGRAASYLTPSTIPFQHSNHLPEQEPWRGKDVNLRRQAKYLKSCKDQFWRRWPKEYLTALCKRHNLYHKRRNVKVQVGDVVLITSEEKIRNN